MSKTGTRACWIFVEACATSARSLRSSLTRALTTAVQLSTHRLKVVTHAITNCCMTGPYTNRARLLFMSHYNRFLSPLFAKWTLALNCFPPGSAACASPNTTFHNCEG